MQNAHYRMMRDKSDNYRQISKLLKKPGSVVRKRYSTLSGVSDTGYSVLPSPLSLAGTLLT